MLLDRLVRQGRAFGIHIILGSQTLGGSCRLATATIDQMAVRIALQCRVADSQLILTTTTPPLGYYLAQVRRFTMTLTG